MGAERLAELLVAVAANRPELKRRLRMELAAEQGADHLLAEIDKRLNALESGRAKVSWRQRATFIRDLDGLRVLLGHRLAGLDAAAALERMWRFMRLAGRLASRLHDRDGAVGAVFTRAARDIGVLLGGTEDEQAADALTQAVLDDPAAWTKWLPAVLEERPPGLAQAALVTMSRADGAVAAWMPPLRMLADAAGDVDAYRATYSAEAGRTPQIAAEIARRLLEHDRVDDAGDVVQAASGAPGQPGGAPPSGAVNFDWETVWIDYLERSGQQDRAQAARWSSFERTLAPERLRAFTQRLADFDDVEAEDRAIRHAQAHRDLAGALRFLMTWPALPAAAALVEARGAASGTLLEGDAEAWAERLRARQPKAAAILFQIAAKAAQRRRDRVAAERLTAEAATLAAG